MPDDKPNKYEVLKDLLNIGGAQTKALYYLKYAEDPEKMDYDNIDDFIMHNESRPAPAELVAEAASLSADEAITALEDCLKRDLVCRKPMNEEGQEKGQDGYYLSEEQSRKLTRAEYMAKESTQMRLWGSKQTGSYL